ncbi:MAG: extracellular solute-binding protein [Desulfohalobiaceae bacterium]|nr:extracellular solute-binding protein [Desulfohalobiaceae bacterium]
MCILTALFFTAVSSWAKTDELVVYSARKEHLIKPLFDRYTEKTQVPVRYVTGKAGVLLQRLKSEGERTPADVLITVDAGNLWHAAKEGILDPVDSPVLENNIPNQYQDPDDRWFGLSLRARTIVYHTRRVSPDELKTYRSLGDPRWEDRLLLRTSKKVYNQSLVASMIAAYGQEETEAIVRSWVDNLAVAPLSSDTKVLKGILAGLGDVGIVNTYYFGRLQKENPDVPLAVFWPNQDSNGVHVNISGGGVVAGSDNRERAVQLLEWLSSKQAQSMFAGLNMEYPANPDVPPVEQVRDWGSFKANPMDVSLYGKYQAKAVRLMDRAGYK